MNSCFVISWYRQIYLHYLNMVGETSSHLSPKAMEKLKDFYSEQVYEPFTNYDMNWEGYFRTKSTIVHVYVQN